MAEFSEVYMSTILDALKKSEQERDRDKLPTLQDMAAPQEASRWPLLLAAAVLLLTGVLGVLAYVIWSSSEQLQTSYESTTFTAAESGQVDASSAASSSASHQRDSSESSDELFSSVFVSIVSYSESDELRFAIVNDKMVREGDFIQTGLKVETILSDKVVFNHRGKKIERSP